MLTPATFGLATDVYTTLPQGSGLQVGDVVQFENSPKFRMLVQYDAAAGGNLALNAACKFKPVTANYIVQATAAITDTMVGCNDLAGVAILPGQFFWITTKGYCFPLVAAGVAAGTIVAPSAVAGTLAAAAAAGEQSNISTQFASGGGGQTLCWKD